MSRRGSEVRKLEGQVLVRLTFEQQQAVAFYAETSRVSMATWIRTVIADAVSVGVGPVIRAKPSELVLEIADLRSHVARLTGALVKAAILTRQDGRQVNHERIEGIISQLKMAVVDLDVVKENLCQYSKQK